MAKQQGRSNRNTSFGKRQQADNDFRKKKADRRSGDSEPRSERRSSSRSEGSGERGERKSYRGSSYEGGRRNFSSGGRGERRSDDRGERRDNRRSDDQSSFKRPFKKPFKKSFSNDGPRTERSRSERPRNDERRDERPRSSRPYGERRQRFDNERPNRRDRGSDKPFRKDRSDRSERPERRSFVEAKVQRHRERVEAPEPQGKQTKNAPAAFQDPDGLIRLNKFISNSGVCSRREADELIKLGLITVNGTTITEMGYKVKPTDDVRHEGKKLTAEKPVYILLNKPKGFITTTDDPQERNTVMELIAGACKERVYPVGRLDRNTTGLLLLTNDGELTEKLTHPSFNAKKIYKVELDKPLTKNDFQRIVDGVKLEEGTAMVDDLAIVSEDSKTVGIELHIGWNHVVRRIFNALEYNVEKLDRVVYAGLDKKDLKRGQWRFLKNDEIVRLKHFK